MLGKKLYGYCEGYFGRDSYEDKTIVAYGCNAGKIWIVVEDEDGYVLFTTFESEKVFDEFIANNEHPNK